MIFVSSSGCSRIASFELSPYLEDSLLINHPRFTGIYATFDVEKNPDLYKYKIGEKTEYLERRELTLSCLQIVYH